MKTELHKNAFESAQGDTQQIKQVVLFYLSFTENCKLKLMQIQNLHKLEQITTDEVWKQNFWV